MNLSTVSDPAPDLGYLPQLDGLRAFAVGAVLVHHLGNPTWFSAFSAVTSLGLAGVRLFFVLSGFLITSLLLRERSFVEASRATRSDVLRRFYLRRALRIFPIYYLVLLIAWILGDADVRAQLPWLATYTYNFWIVFLGWFPDHFSHFWSLCVEEQFYLVWPWVVLIASRRRLVAITVVMVATAPLYRLLAAQLEFPGLAFYVLTPSSFDALGMGALLAIMRQTRGPDFDAERLLRYTALPAGLLGLGLAVAVPLAATVLRETMLALIFMWLVAGAARGFGGIGRHVLQAGPILYCGRISYGIYVYHLFLPGALAPVLEPIWSRLEPSSRGITELLFYVSVAIFVAGASWAWIEHPINRMKWRLAPGP